MKKSKTINSIKLYNAEIDDLSSKKGEGNLTYSLFDKRIWRAKDVAKFLNCTVGHVYNLASDEKIPKRKKNGLLFFVPEEILNWILEGDEK